MITHQQLAAAAKRLSGVLERRDLKIVFAESCTGGLVSATMTGIPGASIHNCGSAVVYQVDTKAQWLGISRSLLDDPGPVSEIVAREMAERVLANTPHADVAASITGHLGPEAPDSQNGQLFVAVSRRLPGGESERPTTNVYEHWLSDEDEAPPRATKIEQIRVERQMAATLYVLQTVAETLADDGA